MSIRPLPFLFLVMPILATASCQLPERSSEKSPETPPIIACPIFDYSAEEAFKEAYVQMDEKDRKEIRQAVLHACAQVNIVFRNGKFDKGSVLSQWEKLYEQEVQPTIKKIWTGPEVDGNCLHPVYLELLNQWDKHDHDPENSSIRQALLVGLNYYDDCRNLCLDSWDVMQPHLSTLKEHGLYRTNEGDWLIQE